MYLIILSVILLIVYLKHLNKDYHVLALCKRIKPVDGSPLKDKVYIIPGKSIFGNNLDFLNTSAEIFFSFPRKCARDSGGKSYVQHFLNCSAYNITSAEDVEEVLQSQSLITKNILYELIRPFLGDGLLISTDKTWHSRRKMLTPAFHFNILETFLDIFKEETKKLIESLESKEDQIVVLHDLIPQFSLNSICETALGVRVDDVEGGEQYRKSIHQIEEINVVRMCNPLLFYPIVYYFHETYKKNQNNLKIAHEFSSKIIQQKRNEYQKINENMEKTTSASTDEFGKKKRYAMLDTLLDAESKGVINHQGICDEVNTFMFEGFDTTSTCIIFSLLNLAWHQNFQQKCYEEVMQLGNIYELSIFDLNKLEYLECFIKEVLRLYPSVPFLGRVVHADTVVNGLKLPQKTLVNIHVFDLMRDPRHFPNPSIFDPNRFLPENTVKRHPFAFIPFSAGPRNCIGQKFAMLEIKLVLCAILKNFIIQPVTMHKDIVFVTGMVLRTQQKVLVKLVNRM